ncbi:MAG: prenyltransferase/squalene oxidase repeat-containing protein [Candidatus Helarchaeota archaeon]
MSKTRKISMVLLGSMVFLIIITPVLAYQDTNPFLTSRKEAVVSYLLARVDSNGGFSEYTGNPNLISTYQGIKSLSLLGVLGEFGKTTTVEWIDSFRNSSNGAYSFSSDLDDVSIAATSHAMSSLVILGESDEIQGTVVDFIDTLQNTDGGYGSKEGNQSTISATQLAIKALSDYNSMNNIDNVSQWLWSRQNNNSLDSNYGAFISNLSHIQYTIVSSWEAVSALKYILQESMTINNTNALINWVKSCQNTVYDNLDKGGFGNNPGEKSSQMIYAASAAGIVKELNRISDINAGLLTNWILSCQNQDGGFGSAPDVTQSSISATYYALFALYSLGYLSTLNDTVPWQELPALSIVGIVLLIMLIASIAAFIIKKRFF